MKDHSFVSKRFFVIEGWDYDLRNSLNTGYMASNAA